MSEAPSAGSEMLPLSLDRQIDAVCFRFESVWLAGKRPRLEDFLGEASAPERSTLLRELLLLEFDYRRRFARSGCRPQKYPSFLAPCRSAICSSLQSPFGLCLGPPDSAQLEFARHRRFARSGCRRRTVTM